MLNMNIRFDWLFRGRVDKDRYLLRFRNRADVWNAEWSALRFRTRKDIDHRSPVRHLGLELLRRTNLDNFSASHAHPEVVRIARVLGDNHLIACLDVWQCLRF